ncbi:MAG: SRPBCC domain-containing protein [Myxococcales bacterium]|nr:SRPBCC domain-containing protein [Myxococcales bacterium]
MSAFTQEITFAAPVGDVFRALTNGEQHSAFTGAPAEITADAGAAWSAYGGAIHGRTIEVVTDQRLVQAWRPGNWEEGVYSLVRIELQPAGAGTRLTLHHSGCPEGTQEHLEAGWHERYWQPLRAHLEG